MNSHITIPRSVLDEFANDKKWLFKYEVENYRISRGFPKTTYTEEGYYSEIIEKALNRHVETPLKTLIDYAKQLPDESVYVLDENIIEIAKLYVKSLFARSPILCQNVINESMLLQFADTTSQEQHDIVVDYAMSNTNIDRINQEYDYTFMVNLTQTPFVIPTRGMYEFAINSVQCINVPITPWCTVLMKQKGKSLLGEDANVSTAVIVPTRLDDIVMRMNLFALEKQKRDNIGYVICNERSILEQLTQK